MRICVLGLGQVGLPTANYILKKGFEVWGYDIDPIVAKKAKEEGILKATSNWRKIPPADVYIVCVSTTFKDDMPDLTPVFDVCKKISQIASSSSLISIESTIIPGTSKIIYEDIFKENNNLIHVPHRFWVEDQTKHGVKQLRVIGAMNYESLKKGLNFYQNILDIYLYEVSSIEVVEMCKIAENTYRYLQIAFAEELKMICENIGINFDDVRNACNTKWNIEILEARDGIGGHCLPKDTRYFASLAASHDARLIKNAIIVDKKYREWLSQENIS